MPSNTIGVAGQGIPESSRTGAGRSIGRAAFVRGLLVLAGCMAAGTSAWSAEPPAKEAAAKQAAAAELFAAIDDGTVEARVIVRDQYHARVILRNKTDAPVALRLPDVFAARPILAQQGFPFPATNQNQNQRQTQPQSVSGPMGSQGGNQGFNMGGQQNQNFFGNNNNVFNIPPESVRSVSIACFCVELGKPNPRSIHPYELVKFDEVGGDATLAAVFERYARGDLDREAVQAAVWHVVNDKSWDELGKLSRKIALNAEAPIFSERQLRLARDLTAHAAREAAEHPERFADKTSQRSAKRVAESPRPVADDAGRSVPASTEKYRTIRGINASR